MCTWKEHFEQLSVAQLRALEKVKNTQTENDWMEAVRIVKSNTDEISRFLSKYESCGSPNHGEKMPDI